MNVRRCLLCEDHILEYEVIRIRIGGVLYEENEDGDWIVQFIQQTGRDRFQDGSTTKWVCKSCANEHNVFTRELDYGSCAIVNGRSLCDLQFEQYNEPSSDCVLEVERGYLQTNNSDKGPSVIFTTEEGGNVHFECACDEPWGLPLRELAFQDAP